MDRWIGLVLDESVDDCGCNDGENDECRTCRSRWTWLDGSPISRTRFLDNEPSRGERCGRINRYGFWAGAPGCDRKLKAVCKKGIFACLKQL